MALEKKIQKKAASKRPSRTQDVCADQLDAFVAELLLPAAEKIREVARGMRAANIQLLSVEHGGMATNGMDSIDRMVASAIAELSLATKSHAKNVLFGE